MINTYNETYLHKTLKNYYKINNPESTEETKIGNFIADIKTKEGNIIEIQTGSLTHLKKKIEYCLKNNIQITIVYPIPCIKYIETYDLNNKLVSKRKSPLQKTIYSSFKELTSLYSFINEQKFKLILLECIITEIRVSSDKLIQSKNNKRHFLKNWQKENKKLEEIIKENIINDYKDILNLLPYKKNELFTVKDVFTKLKVTYKRLKQKDINIFIWVLTKMELIQRTGKKGKAFIYKLI